MTAVSVNQDKQHTTRLSRLLWGKSSKLKRQEAISGILLASPWIIGFIIFTAGPMLASFVIGLTKWDIISPPRFIGLDNYVTMFTKDELFSQSLKVTFTYTVLSAPLHVLLGLLPYARYKAFAFRRKAVAR
jgi:multiple sugar transport system permease protein